MEAINGFPGGSDSQESACPCRRHRRRGFDLWVGNIPWRRKWQPTQVFLPGKSHGQRSLMGYSLWGGKKSDKTAQTDAKKKKNQTDTLALLPSHPSLFLKPTILWLLKERTKVS